MTENHWLAEAVEVCGLPASGFPRDVRGLKEDVCLALPLSVVEIPRLTSSQVREWLVAHKRAHGGLPETDRRLHGCMVAMEGKGVLFHDNSDEASEQRFTVAHEVSHFVLDHFLLRHRALRAFGASILPVLNGQREPTVRERLFSVIDRVPLGLQVNLMGRNPSRDPLTGKTMEAEWRADRLAFELLAPENDVRGRLQDTSTHEEAVALLVKEFGLPMKEARSYSRMLGNQEDTQSPSLLDFMRAKKRG